MKEYTKIQHASIVFGRLTMAILFTFGPMYGLRDRFGFADDDNTITYSHSIFVFVTFIVELQFLYAIAHLIQLVYSSEDFLKSRKLTSYILEVLVDLFIIVPTIILLNRAWDIPIIRMKETYFDNMSQLKQYFDNDFMILAIIPQAVLYVIQLCVLMGNMRIELQLHHFIALMYTIVFLASEVSSGLLLFMLLQNLFAMLEFPLFTGLVIYRVSVKGQIVTDTPSATWARLANIFSVLRIYWAVTRIVLVILLVYTLVKHFESFTLFVQILYPIAIAVQIGTLGLTQKEIHGIHARMEKNRLASKAFEDNGKMPSTRSIMLNDETRRSMMSVRNINE